MLPTLQANKRRPCIGEGVDGTGLSVGHFWVTMHGLHCKSLTAVYMFHTQALFRHDLYIFLRNSTLISFMQSLAWIELYISQILMRLSWKVHCACSNPQWVSVMLSCIESSYCIWLFFFLAPITKTKGGKHVKSIERKTSITCQVFSNVEEQKFFLS